MSSQVSGRPAGGTAQLSGDWLTQWVPEDNEFWKSEGSRIAWRTLTLTTIALVLSFATWFLFSALAVNFAAVGIRFSEDPKQNERLLFWLVAMPGLAGGTLRVLHTFLTPMFGTRRVITVAVFAKLIPCLGIAWAVTTPGTPYWVYVVLALLLGMGGGDFSSHMPSTSLFFPKRLQGTALGIQAGVGNFGVSLTQFVTPWIIGVASLASVTGPSQLLKSPKGEQIVWLQNAALWYVPLLMIVGVVCWIQLRSVPVKASFREQLDIFKDRHTWNCTITYMMTFGSFSGFAAAFPMLIRSLYGGFGDGSPNPLAYAFLGPLIGSAVRVAFGFVADRTGGAILTHWSGIGMIALCVAMVLTGVLAPTSLDSFPLFVGMMLGIFFCAGVGNAATFRQFPLIFSHNPRQGAQVLGWTGAVAAYGPFLFSSLIGETLAWTGERGDRSAAPFFLGAAAFFVVAVVINWVCYTRKGCSRPS
jgi:NNP family nitrate/nitrite transporter-like MFS transporter